MKKAILILGIIIMVLNFIQANTAVWAGRFFDDPSLYHGGSAGRLVTVFIGVALILLFYRIYISLAIFSAAGILLVVLGLFMGYYDIVFWGAASLGLAVLCYFASEENTDT